MAYSFNETSSIQKCITHGAFEFEMSGGVVDLVSVQKALMWIHRIKGKMKKKIRAKRVWVGAFLLWSWQVDWIIEHGNMWAWRKLYAKFRKSLF